MFRTSPCYNDEGCGLRPRDANPGSRGKMRVRGWFVGIDEFKDPSVPSLSGAARDAMALHAIFKDGIPGIQTTLLQ